MLRRTALMAVFGIMGQIVRDDTERKFAIQAPDSVAIGLTLPDVSQDLIVHIGATNGGFERFHITDGIDTITFTASELMAALKA